MNARDRLYLVACSDMPVTNDEVEEAIDDYAHELAEQIRKMDTDPCTQWAADSIDPKVQRTNSSKEPTP